MQKPDVEHRLLAEWKKLLLQPGTKATVSSVCKGAHLSRQTFYMHFDNLAVLSEWSFRDMIARALDAANVPSRYLVTPSRESGDPFPRMCYYYRRPQGARRVDCSLFFQICAQVVQSEREYYIAVLRSAYALEFRRYLHGLYVAAFEEDIRIMLGGRSMPRDRVRLIAHTMAYASLDCYFDELMLGERSIEELVAPDMPNLVHDGAHYAIEAYYARQGRKIENLNRSRFVL